MTTWASRGHVRKGAASHAMEEACAWLLWCRPTSAEWEAVRLGLQAFFRRRFGVTR